MAETTKSVVKAGDLAAALMQDAAVIGISGVITGLKRLHLPRETGLRGITPDAALQFEDGQSGILLSADSFVSDVRVVVDEAQIALGLIDDTDDLGSISITDVTAVGRVHLEGALATRGTIRLARVHVESADARMVAHRPAGYGVEALLGAITVYNASRDPRSRWTVEALDLSVGDASQPARGSGVFVFGGATIPLDADTGTAPAPSRQGGSIDLHRLTTREIHVDGGIPPGTGNLISAGVFVGAGVEAREVLNDGTTTTYGPGDTVLDNWGDVDVWTARAKVTSHGDSGIGFVNFGRLGTLSVAAPIETYGVGARGFNLYDGSLGSAAFQSIITHGEGAIGIQLSKPFGSIHVDGDVRTTGSEGDSLVRGKVVRLNAHGISLKSGATGDHITVGGAVTAENATIGDWEFEAPATVIARIEIAGQLGVPRSEPAVGE